MESFWHSMKVAETHGRSFDTREEARRCVFPYIEGFYNTMRMRSSLNWMSPSEFQKQFDENLRVEKQQHNIYRRASRASRAGHSPQTQPSHAATNCVRSSLNEMLTGSHARKCQCQNDLPVYT